MKNIPRFETRSQVLIRYTRAMIHETSETEGSFTLRLMETYNRLVPPHNRSFRFADTGRLENDLKANTQRVRRWMAEQAVSSDGRLCIDLEEAWKEALLDPYRSNCKAELVRRDGFLPVPMPSLLQGADSQSLADYVREFADPIPLIAQMLANGEFDSGDRPTAGKAIRELEEAAAFALHLAHVIKAKVYGDQPDIRMGPA